MEFVTFNTEPHELAEALRGAYGKHVDKDCQIVFFGNAAIGIGVPSVLDKRIGVSHYDWKQIGDNVWFCVLK